MMYGVSQIIDLIIMIEPLTLLSKTSKLTTC